MTRPGGTGAPEPLVVVVGSLNRDYVCTVERLPGAGETVLGSELVLHAGGKGGNQAVAAALVGAVTGTRCALVGAVGCDPDGEELLVGQREAGVDVGAVHRVPDVRTGAALITVDRDGANTIVVAPGANHRLEEGAAEAALDELVGGASGRPVVVVLQGELTTAVTATVARRAAEVGARVVLNLAPVGPLPDDVLALCDPLVVNESEAAALARDERDAAADGQDGEVDLATAQRLAARARSVVVTVGAEGALVAVGDTVTRVPAPSCEVVDSTGAGDAFTGALAVGLALGRDVVGAARWGVAVASWSVGRPGAQASYPRGQACEQLLEHGAS